MHHEVDELVTARGVCLNGVIESVTAIFKGLVAVKPYRSITVKEICEGAFISRRTFYANFIDKRAIVAYLFREDAVKPVERALELLSVDEARELAPVIIARFYQGLLDERDYYCSLVKPMAGVDATFELVVARALKKFIELQVRRFNPQVDKRELDDLAYYHAGGSALFLERWICNGCVQAPDELGKLHAEIIASSLGPLLRGKPES